MVLPLPRMSTFFILEAVFSILFQKRTDFFTTKRYSKMFYVYLHWKNNISIVVNFGRICFDRLKVKLFDRVNQTEYFDTGQARDTHCDHYLTPINPITQIIHISYGKKLWLHEIIQTPRIQRAISSYWVQVSYQMC